MNSRFEARLEQGPIVVGDGGMGVLVTSAGATPALPGRGQSARARECRDTAHELHPRRRRPDRDEHLRRQPAQASQLYLEDEFERINSAGVKLAREAREVAGREVFIAGSIGPLGDLAVPPDKRIELFAEQAALLDGRGIDLFMVETFYDLDELEAAIEAVRGVSSLPIVATLTFDEGAETLAGVTAAERGRAACGR